eukprot:15190928-Alexandrium_andersonii.AAC.1
MEPQHGVLNAAGQKCLETGIDSKASRPGKRRRAREDAKGQKTSAEAPSPQRTEGKAGAWDG